MTQSHKQKNSLYKTNINCPISSYYQQHTNNQIHIPMYNNDNCKVTKTPKKKEQNMTQNHIDNA